MKDEDTLRPEYPAELIKSGVRGKYVKGYREGTNIVVIAPELHKLFPDSDSVNKALRQYAKEHGMALA
ncbi:hypothetical protein [Candidatus Thiosymbion oneisti]|uniref:hypothetical protein n=1 Tax=Candidatus Thiosymbion oneisti TaxID=589554 RepID=UPI000B7F71EA|nr:hypothetical protein [Candidatus Thiosymbion oneisti]